MTHSESTGHIQSAVVHRKCIFKNNSCIFHMLIRAYIMVSVTVLNQMELCKKKIHMTRIHSALEEILHYDLCKLAKQF